MLIDIVVGGQYGSEGKGAVVAQLVRENKYDFVVRTGGPNAGHSIIHNRRKFAMQQVPCGWIDEECKLVLGAGAVINPRILEREIQLIKAVAGIDVSNRLFVDHRATVITEEHEQAEGHTRGEIHKRIGSTGEGVGAARMGFMARNAGLAVVASDIWSTTCDTIQYMHYYPKPRILLEGTQGYGLSLHIGEWPYLTSANATSAQLLSDAGLPPNRTRRIVQVIRTFPIRVAGNSGNLANEITWDDVSKSAGRDVAEHTTVTRKVRRVGGFDMNMVIDAAKVNGTTELVLNFVDYLGPDNHGALQWRDLNNEARIFHGRIEKATKLPVTMMGTGFFEDERGWTFVRP